MAEQRRDGDGLVSDKRGVVEAAKRGATGAGLIKVY